MIIHYYFAGQGNNVRSVRNTELTNSITVDDSIFILPQPYQRDSNYILPRNPVQDYHNTKVIRQFLLHDTTYKFDFSLISFHISTLFLAFFVQRFWLK